MAQNVNYYISRVRYNLQETHIEKVEVYGISNESLTSPSEWTRQQVISTIERGYIIMTMYKRNGKWEQGEHVRVITVNGVKYIRTDSNNSPKDNLGNLPRF